MRVLKERKFIGEVIDNDDIPVKFVKNIRHGGFLPGDLDIFKVPYGIVGHVAEQTAIDVFRVRVRNVERASELIKQIYSFTFFRQDLPVFFSVGENCSHLLPVYLEGCDGIATDKGQAVFVSMVVRALQQKAAGKNIPQLQIDVYRRQGIRE